MATIIQYNINGIKRGIYGKVDLGKIPGFRDYGPSKKALDRCRVLENPGHGRKDRGSSRRMGVPMTPRVPHGVWAADPRPMWSYPEANHVFQLAADAKVDGQLHSTI